MNLRSHVWIPYFNFTRMNAKAFFKAVYSSCSFLIMYFFLKVVLYNNFPPIISVFHKKCVADGDVVVLSLYYALSSPLFKIRPI